MCILVLWNGFGMSATWNGFGRWKRGKSAEVAYQRDVLSKIFLTHPSGLTGWAVRASAPYCCPTVRVI